MSDAVRHLAERLLAEGPAHLPTHERRVIERLARRLAAGHTAPHGPDDEPTVGERVADAVAAWGGSWPFIFVAGAAMALWMGLNGAAGAAAFDPFPFILLNLALSALAALQAPVIMMSQNRQAAKDRAQAIHDYEVNLKAELEIMALHEKVDQLRAADLAAVLARIEVRILALETRA